METKLALISECGVDVHNCPTMHCTAEIWELFTAGNGNQTNSESHVLESFARLVCCWCKQASDGDLLYCTVYCKDQCTVCTLFSVCLLKGFAAGCRGAFRCCGGLVILPSGSRLTA